VDSSERRLEHLTARCPAQRCRRRRTGTGRVSGELLTRAVSLVSPNCGCLDYVFFSLSLSVAELRVSERITMTSSRRRRARTTTVLLYSWSSTYIYGCLVQLTSISCLVRTLHGQGDASLLLFFFPKKKEKRFLHANPARVRLELGPPVLAVRAPRKLMCVYRFGQGIIGGRRYVF
jgi:hypothetical protein